MIIIPVSNEPVTIDEAKLHLRLTDDIISGDTVEDELVLSLIVAAREYCEQYTGRALATQTQEMYLDEFPCRNEINLMPDIQSVTSVTCVDGDGNQTVLSEDIDYLVDVPGSRIVLPYRKTWPAFEPYPINPIRIRYVTGYTNAPQTIKQAMLLLIGHWYANREATGEASGQIDFAVKALLSHYRVRWF